MPDNFDTIVKICFGKKQINVYPLKEHIAQLII
ncbi:hypothetical protein EV690_2025 [Celerinatantimonas diazotrophica]|uniref:Uncharacterized protein n=1 Tax=Celerinatantimonas diazotrophica TaxID=412034 RepID=A0A4R1JLK3_9GAMM|nr:hypothetical protein EV690_2025 [Celerinatantimonas diazotrophica]CAG9296369.1 hypothetical protein CEDIAZO_01518 [Celerinatantimonas diazotrophica]